jgi:hypothetical protein
MVPAMLRLIRHTLRFPLLSGLSLLMAVACTALVLVLPGVTMRFIDTIIGKNRPDLILSTALIGVDPRPAASFHPPHLPEQPPGAETHPRDPLRALRQAPTPAHPVV